MTDRILDDHRVFAALTVPTPPSAAPGQTKAQAEALAIESLRAVFQFEGLPVLDEETCRDLIRGGHSEAHRRMAEIVRSGLSLGYAREAVAVRMGDLGGDSGNE